MDSAVTGKKIFKGKKPHWFKPNSRIKMEGLKFLKQFSDNSVSVCFFDPQYRGILDKMKYGNEGQNRGKARCQLRQMTEKDITSFISEISRTLCESSHLFLWIDKFHLCTGFTPWIKDTDLRVVDMITWDKGRMGMGYRTRRRSEYLIILQKTPLKAKGVWRCHNIPDVWQEKVQKNGYAHTKPIGLQAALIEAVCSSAQTKNFPVIDPASGSFSVLKACQQTKRTFVGCDING